MTTVAGWVRIKPAGSIATRSHALPCGGRVTSRSATGCLTAPAGKLKVAETCSEETTVTAPPEGATVAATGPVAAGPVEGAAHLPALQLPKAQSAAVAQATPNPQVAPQCPPQSTALSPPFWIPSPQLGARQTPPPQTPDPHW